MLFRSIELAGMSCLIVSVLGLTLVACSHSAYFSAANIAFGNEALEQLKKQAKGGIGTELKHFADIIIHGTGALQLFLITALTATESLRKYSAGNPRQFTIYSWTAKIGLIVGVVSIAICYQTTLLLQARYLFPFISVTIVLLTPMLIRGIERAGRAGMACLLLMPIGLLVGIGTPSLAGISGVIGGYSLHSGGGKKEILLSRKLLRENTQASQIPPILFHNYGHKNDSLLAFIAGYTKNLEELGYSDAQINQSVRSSINWDRDPVITIDSIYNADILAFDMADHKNKRNIDSQATDFSSEQRAWVSWLEKTAGVGSTKLVQKSPELIVLAIKNRDLLEKQMRAYIASRTWRTEFLAANKIRNYSPAQIDTQQLSGDLIKKPISYDNRLRVYGLTISRATPNADKIVATVYSERLPGGKKDTLSLFIHELDNSKNIVAMHEIPLSTSRLAGRPISMDETTFQAAPKTEKLAIGVYEPKIGAIRTDWSRSTDWDGRRATIDLDSLPLEQHSDR